MANDLNRVLIVGRLTRDPELRSTNSGHVLCRFSVASNRAYYKKEGDLQEEVGYFDCVAWGKIAEIISKYVTKGRRIGIDGSLRWSQWENPEGKKQSKVEIHIENFQFLDPKGAQIPETSPQSSEIETQETVGTTSDSSGSEIMNDDDIPF